MNSLRFYAHSILRRSRLGAAIVYAALACLVFCSAGCGGGTSGTGIRTFDGDVRSDTGEPLAGVLVTIPSTGDEDTTDSTGHFFIVSRVQGDDVELMLETASLHGTVIVPASDDSGTRVAVDLIVDTGTNDIHVTNFALRVVMVGPCGKYFKNGAVIRQTDDVPSDTTCTLKARLEGDGDLRGDASIALQYASCGNAPVWQTITTALTGEGADLGVARIPFEFMDSVRFCRYRVVGPYRDGQPHPALFPILTITAQEIYKAPN